MSEWAAKRFWSEASVQAEGTGFRVYLDARELKTPNKTALDLPTRAMAEAIAAEWDAQEGEIAPLTMPVTRGANSAIDRVAPQKPAVADMLAAYAETDLLSHRATAPAELQALQAAAWDALLDWAEGRYGARLSVTEGILATTHDPSALAALSRAVHAMDAFEMTALHDLVTLSGSLIIGLAVAEGHLDPAVGWDRSRIDEEWQIDLWGRDEEADALAAAKRAQFLQAKTFWDLSHTL